MPTRAGRRPPRRSAWPPTSSSPSSPTTAAPASPRVDPTVSDVAIETAAGAPIWRAGRLDPDAGLPGRWQRELERRQAQLRRGPRGRAGTITALLGLLNALDGEVPRSELVALLSDIGKSRRRHPLVRSHAVYLLSQLLASQGRTAQAQQGYVGAGYLLDWQLVGPFENQGRAGHDFAYAPETEAFDATQRFVGTLANEALEWRHYPPEAGVRAYVSFDAYLRPNTFAVGYATTWIHVPRAQSAVLHVGSGGPYKIWVNGRLAGDGGAYRRPHPLQDAHAVQLRAGANRVLIKLSVEQGSWGFFARLSDRKGRTISSATHEATPSADAVAAVEAETPESIDAEPALVSLRAKLEQAARRERARPRDRIALLEFYRYVAPFGDDDDTAVVAARQVDAALQTSESAWLLALIDDDQNESRRALTTGIERARREGASARSRLAEMLTELAWRYQSLGLDARARELFAEAHAVAPDDAMVELVLVDQLARDGFDLAALDWLDDLLRRYPKSSTLRRDKAARLREIGRPRQGLALLEQLGAETSRDASITSARIDLHMQLGEVKSAIALAERLVAGNPGRVGPLRDLAELLEADERIEPAVAVLGEAVKLAPQDAELHAEMGHLLGRAGHRLASIAAFRRSLELRPQQPELHDLLALLDASGHQDLVSRYVEDLDTIVAEAGEIPASWKGKEAGMLHQLYATRVHKNGLSERVEHRVIRILDERGTRSQAVQAFTYDPGESYVQVRRARVRRANGRVEEIGTPRVVSLAEAGYRMYYDQRQVRVGFPGLRPGDVLEVVFVRRDVAARNKFDEYFGDLVPLQGGEPRLSVDYVLEAPADKPLYFNREMERSESKDAATAIYRYRGRDIPAIKPESNMPGWAEVADLLHVSTYADWDAVGRWYWGLVKDQLIVDDAIRTAVRGVLGELPADASPRVKVDALYRHVIRSTRYVGLEFGIHGYKPYKTTDIYDRRFGDCKDKASLLKVMLAEAGIASHLVLVRTRDQGEIAPAPASLSAFNHAIVYVPSVDLYLDGTAEYAGPDELPVGDQGASVLVVRDGEGATFGAIPVSSAAANESTSHQRVALRPDGGASVRHEFGLTGAEAANWRTAFQAEGERVERLTRYLGRRFPGVEVQSATFAGMTDVLATVGVQAELRVPAWAQRQGSGLRFRATGHPSNLVSGLAAQVRRDHDLVLPTPSRRHATIEYELPRGLQFSQVPAPIRLDSPFGRFSLTVASSADKATVETVLELNVQRVAPDDYRAFRDFLRRVDASYEQAFEVEEAR
ncbi:MAG: DUF3857 domain-containing protein [Myxococcales bacterium FL481]|nr:MAG: DUF3857 domain-containing protein [Myxococcales bacterium FL481]